jgi:hypothetical protein
MASADIVLPFDAEEDDGEDWRRQVAVQWITELRRLLIRARGLRHGGAVLITPTAAAASSSLRVKYRFDYTRLKDALVNRAVSDQKRDFLYFMSWEALAPSDDSDDEPTIDDFMEVAIAEGDVNDCDDEVDGILWFLALLTRVDGLVLMEPDLTVRGFGVEILEDTPPDKVFVARDASGALRREMDYDKLGTRHRSMMRYCAWNEGALGVVISQDGDVRVMIGTAGVVTVWDSLALQFEPPFVVPDVARALDAPEVEENG